jgi:hypothetical protein
VLSVDRPRDLPPTSSYGARSRAAPLKKPPTLGLALTNTISLVSKGTGSATLSFNGSLKVADTTTVTGTFLDRFGGTVETTKGGLPSTALLVSPHPASAADTVIPIAKTLVARNSASSRIISHAHCGRVPKSTALNRPGSAPESPGIPGRFIGGPRRHDRRHEVGREDGGPGAALSVEWPAVYHISQRDRARRWPAEIVRVWTPLLAESRSRTRLRTARPPTATRRAATA